MSRDGEEFQSFHKLCDNKGGPTLTLIKSEDGNILGSYITLDWDSKSEWKIDLNMFAFSLTENVKYIKNNNDKYGIDCNQNNGPYTDIHQFYESNKKMKETYVHPEVLHLMNLLNYQKKQDILKIKKLKYIKKLG